MKKLLFTFIILTGAFSAMVYSAETPSYGFSKTLDLSYEEALNKVSAELKELGFGIITEIDVQATMKKKLDVDIKPYKILGACNPSFAYAAIQAETHIGLFLPCNVIVYVNEDNQTVVSAVDPVAMMAAVENPELAETANKVRESLKRVIDNL